MAKHTVKNISTGIRGFHSADGLVELAPGTSTTEPVEISAHEYASAKRTGWFDMDGEPDSSRRRRQGPRRRPRYDDPQAARNRQGRVGRPRWHDEQERYSGAIRLARTAKADGGSGNDALDAMDDATLRSTVQAITGKTEADVADLDRPALLALARGEG